MYGSMVESNLRRLGIGDDKNKEEKEKKKDRNHCCKIECPHLLRRAAIKKKPQDENIMACPIP